MIGLKSMKTVIDENELNKKLKFLINNKDIRERMGREGKNRWHDFFSWEVVSKQYRELWINLKEIRESCKATTNSIGFHPPIDYIFKNYPTEINCEERLIVDSQSTKPEMLLFPLHSKLVNMVTTNKTKKIIELINKNKSITLKDLSKIGIHGKKQKEIMALIEKLGIAKKQI